jgi:nucleotide-binding universal stress UspA family protein
MVHVIDARPTPNPLYAHYYPIPTPEQILRIAAEPKASLIVIAARGRTGLSRLALGSVAERVIREAPCPVRVVR